MEAKITGGDIKVTSKNARIVASQLMKGELLPEQLDKNAFRMILCYVVLPMPILNKYWEYFTEFEKSLVSRKQELTEDFMTEHRDELNWRSLCRYQKMSEVFMRTHEEYLDFEMVWNYQTLSEKFKSDYMQKANDWIMRYGKFVNSNVRLGKITEDVIDEPTELINNTEIVNPPKEKPKKKKKKYHGTHKKQRDIYSYSDLY